ncbi:ATP-binding protein [Leeuwenhoekiella sp. MAR_2009_132]|uniref:ATP-binding protein n=1 Tax=Leeuwenhoekiella sp. MAR_2009_132 TaxID=1392489 RepID=UPI00068FA92D|nr:ATP-binding protein [Leeuwenhoekiella sp. MAR_2009_132]
MNSFIDRLFTQRASRLSKEEVTDPKSIFFQYLLGLGTYSKRLQELKSQIANFTYPDDVFTADLCCVNLYLDLENYLITYDNAYINTKENLRQELREKFPVITNSMAFMPLYESGKNKEILIARIYLLTVLRKLKLKNTELASTIAWIEALKASINFKSSDDLVKQINAFRRVKDDAFKITKEFNELLGSDTVTSIFDTTKDEFYIYYNLLPAVTCIADVIPNSFTSILNETKPIINLDFDTIKKDIQKISTPPANFPVYGETFSILENLLDGYLLFDALGTIRDCNTLALKIFGYTKTELVNNSVFKLFPDDLTTLLKTDLQNLYSVTETEVIGHRIETDIANRAGISSYYEISFSNNFASPEDSFTALIKNISNRKDTLKAKINAERVAEAKTTFLSNMSHEIRTPLNVILGLSEIISKSDLQDQQLLRKNIDGISFSAKNLLSIVNDILDFSKIEAGKLTLQSLDFNLREVVTNLTSGFEIKGKEKGIAISVEIDDTIPKIVVGDQFRLNQILTNLVGNAIKFTKKGYICIELNLLNKTEHSNTIEFKVTDTGIGIVPDKLESIFESFYQVEGKENAKINGTGLGLTITRELIALQQGKLNAESELGKGSTFSFTIDFKSSKLKKIKNTDLHKHTNSARLSDLRILVAEDNKMNQFYIRQLLQGLGVEADIAENGEEAVAIYKNNSVQYDLILMDMHMPVMNGLEAISLIRQSHKDSLHKVPIVACSADVFPESRKNAIKAGIDFYLTKPLKEEDLKEVLYWLISDEKPVINTEETIRIIENTESTESTNYVNIAQLLEIFDNDTAFIISLLEVFISETPEDLNSLRNCVAREYYPRASTLAHKLKSSFMNLGMTTHGHHLQQIESTIIVPSKTEEAKKHLRAFEEIYTKALIEINILIIKLKQE